MSVTTTSADGLTVTTQINQDGDVDASNNPIFDYVQTSVTTKNADDSSTVVTTNLGGDGHTVIDTTTTTTSADGLRMATTSNVGGADRTTTDVTTIAADGSRTQIIRVTAPGDGADPTPVLLSAMEITTSADQSTTIVAEDTNGDGVVDRRTAHYREVSGATVDETKVFAPDGSLISEIRRVTSADGLATTETTNIDGKIDSITTDVIVLNIDGSTTETVTKRANDGTLISQTATTISANGFSSTTTTSIDGKVDSTITDTRSIAANGDLVEVVTSYDPSNAKINSTQITSSANGLLKTTLTDENGDGIFDIETTDQTTLNVADGSVTELFTTRTVAASPVTLGRTQIFTSADGLTAITSVDDDGDGVYDEVTRVVRDPVGNEVMTVAHYDHNNDKINEALTTIHANGLFVETQTDVNGDGTFDRTQTDSTVLHQDGSRTETVTTLAGSTTVGTTVVTTSANGTIVTAQHYIDGTEATGTLIETDQSEITYNSDGTITKISTVKSQSGATVERSTTQVSADRNTTTITTNYLPTTFAGNQADKLASSVETRLVEVDGSLRDTVVYYALSVASGMTLVTKTAWTSANGLEKTLFWDLNGDGTNDVARSNVITLGADGSTTESFSESDAFPGTTFAENVAVTTTTSADGLTSSTSSSINLGEDWSFVDKSRRTFINPDGSMVEVTTNNVSVLHCTDVGSGYAIYVEVYSGSDAAVITTSRDGLTKTKEISTWGNNNFDQVDSLAAHLDGSTTRTITNLNDDNSLGELKTVDVSADGRTITITDYTYDHGYTNYLVQTTIPTYDTSNKAISLTTTSNYTSNGGELLNTERNRLHSMACRRPQHSTPTGTARWMKPRRTSSRSAPTARLLRRSPKQTPGALKSNNRLSQRRQAACIRQ
ncbi:MAG: hypothetical protein HC834_02715 [Rhodospirillales bacterium]|nr:hypothetical protein [Rhodospirillales bacterium]